MRSILRAAGRTARGVLWLAKGLLLILAVAVLVVWPVSRGNAFGAWRSSYTERSKWADEFQLAIGCRNGRICAAHRTNHYSVDAFQVWGTFAPWRNSQGWKWSAASGNGADFPDVSFDGWGPLRWKFQTTHDPNYATEWRSIAISCWLLAPLLALWPLISFTLLIRRRTRRRHRLATGCCLSCGYDLRATPLPGGEVLARCPECGAAASPP
jgi:hypothetical protein